MSPPLLWNSVTIVGCGLIGGSFALALREAHACARIAGWDTDRRALDRALTLGVIDELDDAFAPPAAFASASDLIYLSMPVGAITNFLQEYGRRVKRGATITDAGSTKLEVCRAARTHLPTTRRFVGGHPIAGSHHRGMVHAHGDLFRGQPYVLTIGDELDGGEAVATLKRFLELIGARVQFMSPEEHDQRLALISHLPQIVSSALARLVEEHSESESLLELSGTGYRDVTRLAGSSWSVWRDILTTNCGEMAPSLDMLLEKLSAVRDELRSCTQDQRLKLSTTRSLFEKP